jgi:hypothetical protein
MSSDRLSRAALVVIDSSLAWMAVRPHVAPRSVEAAGETVRVDQTR